MHGQAEKLFFVTVNYSFLLYLFVSIFDINYHVGDVSRHTYMCVCHEISKNNSAVKLLMTIHLIYAFSQQKFNHNQHLHLNRYTLQYSKLIIPIELVKMFRYVKSITNFTLHFRHYLPDSDNFLRTLALSPFCISRVTSSLVGSFIWISGLYSSVTSICEGRNMNLLIIV